VIEVPETRYAETADGLQLAYQVVGDGPLDLLYCGGASTHIELVWEHPIWADFLRRLASFSRLILFDRRGFGASDHFPRGAMPTWEGWAEDIEAVLDATGSAAPAIFGEFDGGRVCLLFTAMHPERVRALILGNTTARFLAADDYPIGHSPATGEALARLVEERYGSLEFAKLVWPSRAEDNEFLRWATRMARAAATPRAAGLYYRFMIESGGDYRSVLPLIQVPTLVLHNTGNPYMPVEHGRYLAAAIDGAKLVEYPSDDAVFGGELGQPVADEVAEFVTGQPVPIEIDRVLTTVLFTDIVGSTHHAASLGDHKWRAVLDDHDRAVREQLRRFRGGEIKTTGDGFVASFDGPARAIRCAGAIVEATGALGVSIRAGLHTGECDVRGDDLSGLAVHVAARVGAQADAGEVLVSGTVRDLVMGSGIEFDDRGEHELKGVPGTWKLFVVKR